MAKNPPMMKAWCETLGALADEKAEVRAWCSTCGKEKVVDLAAIAQAYGWEFSLIDRFPRCRLTPECAGRVTFRAVLPGANAWPMFLRTEEGVRRRARLLRDVYSGDKLTQAAESRTTPTRS